MSRTERTIVRNRAVSTFTLLNAGRTGSCDPLKFIRLVLMVIFDRRAHAEKFLVMSANTIEANLNRCHR